MRRNIFLFFWKTIDVFRARTSVSRCENKKLPCTRASEASYRTNAMISSSYRRRPRISLTCLCIRRVILAHVRISLDRLGENRLLPTFRHIVVGLRISVITIYRQLYFRKIKLIFKHVVETSIKDRCRVNIEIS